LYKKSKKRLVVTNLNYELPLVFLKTKGDPFYANDIEVVDVLLPASA